MGEGRRHAACTRSIPPTLDLDGVGFAVETDNADASAAEGVPRTIVVDPPIPLPPSSTQGAAGEDDGDLHQP